MISRLSLLLCSFAFGLVLATPALAAPPANPPTPLEWHNARDLHLQGKGWTDTQSFYDRLPARAQNLVRPAVWSLSHDSAGLCVRFATDASSISARWTLRKENLAMAHMPASGVSGVDLYV